MMSKLHATRIISYLHKTMNLTHLLIPEDKVSSHLYESSYFNSFNVITFFFLDNVAANSDRVKVACLVEKCVLSPGSVGLNIDRYLTQTFLCS